MLVTVPVSCPDQLHSVPIAQMGNYQDFLKAAPQPLRDADPEQPKRLHTFGNPFKLDKKVDARARSSFMRKIVQVDDHALALSVLLAFSLRA